MKRSSLFIVIAGILIAISIAVFLSPFASSFPDGLERVAEKYGFSHMDQKNVSEKSVPAADYTLPGIKNKKNSTAAAGLIGTLAVFLIAWGAGVLLNKSKRNDTNKNSTEQIS